MENLINFCIAGLGHWGPNFIRAINSHPSARIVAAVEPNAMRAQIVKDRQPDLEIFADLQECFKKTDVDAVVVATPSDDHYETTIASLKAKKHVFVEKPFALNRQAADKMIALAEENKKILMVGHIYLYNNCIKLLKSIINEGTLGSLLYIRSLRTNFGPIRSDVSALWDLATHDISIFNYLFDELPLKVSGNASCLIGGALEDIAQGNLWYSNNCTASFFVSWLEPQKLRKITVVGTKKMVVFDDMNLNKPLQLFDTPNNLRDSAQYSDSFESFRDSITQAKSSIPDVKIEEPLKNQCHHFIDCIVRNGKPITGGRNGRDVICVLEALRKSCLQGGRQIKLGDLMNTQIETNL